MKRKLTVVALCLLAAVNGMAFVVSVDGAGEIPAEGMNLTVAEAEWDILTNQNRMEVKGKVLTYNPLTVTITRTSVGMNDEFCCADQCTAGNGQTEETLFFTPNGLADWYVHYTPAPLSDQTVVYLFSDGAETRTLTVRYIYDHEGLERIQPSDVDCQKTLRNGQVLIEGNGKTYNVTGIQVTK